MLADPYQPIYTEEDGAKHSDSEALRPLVHIQFLTVLRQLSAAALPGRTRSTPTAALRRHSTPPRLALLGDRR